MRWLDRRRLATGTRPETSARSAGLQAVGFLVILLHDNVATLPVVGGEGGKRQRETSRIDLPPTITL